MSISLLLKRYGFLGCIRLIRDLIVTKLFFPRGCRVIRWPYYIRNSGNISYGQGFTTGIGLRVDVFADDAKLVFGNNIQLNDYVHIGVCNSVTIGNNTLIASKVFISDHNHGFYAISDVASSPIISPISRPIQSAPITIGDNVWLGENVTVLSGVTLGHGVVAAAGSVITQSFPDNVMLAGVPAKIIKTYCFETHRWKK